MRRYQFLIVLFLISITACRKVESPSFKRIENFKIKQLGLQGTTIGLDITFLNPNNFGLNIKDASCDVFLDSLFIGKFTQDHTIDVLKHSEFSLPLSGTIPIQTALKMDFNKLINKDVLFRADGSAKIGKGGIYILRPFNYKGVHKIGM